MKKFYFFFIILFFTKALTAQQYYPMLDSINSWNYTTNYIPVRMSPSSTVIYNCNYPFYFMNSMMEFTTTDTLINTSIYKKVFITADGNPTPCFFGWVREDTIAKKVFFLDNLGNPEITLYDFSMLIGNTIAIQFTTQGYFQTGTFTLDSITSVHSSSGFHRVFHLNDHANSLNHELKWIEGIGNLEDAFYPYSYNGPSTGWYWNCPGFPHDNWQFMTCFDHDYKVYYDSCAYVEAVSNGCIFFQDTCNYWNICSKIAELNNPVSFDVFPNPSSGITKFSIETASAAEYKILIYDLSGKKILKEIPLGIIDGNKNAEINLSDLPDSFYFAELKSEKSAEFRKIIIAK